MSTVTPPARQRAVRGSTALPPPDRERVRGKPQVRLGLAATGREEQQLCGGQVSGPLRRRGIGEQRELHQHERELERVPGVRSSDPRRAPRRGPLDGLVRVRGPRGWRPALDALVGHDRVHEPEAAQRLVVGEQVLQAVGELPLTLRASSTASRPSARRCSGSSAPALLPSSQAAYARRSGTARRELVGGGRRQRAHVEHGVDRVGRDLRRLTTGSQVVHTAVPAARPSPPSSPPSRSGRPRTPAGPGTEG